MTTASNGGGGGIVVRATTRSRHQRIRRCVIKGFVTFVLWIRCLSGDDDGGDGGVDIWIVKYKYN